MDYAKIINDAVRMGEKNGFKLDRETLDNLKCVAKKLEAPVAAKAEVPAPVKVEIPEVVETEQPSPVEPVRTKHGRRSPRKK